MKKILSFLGIIAMIMTFSCQKNGTDQPAGNTTGDNSGEGGGGGTTYTNEIVIDGQFEDWANVDPSLIVTCKTNSEAKWEGVTQMKIFATKDAVFYYAEYDSDILDSYKATNSLFPGRVNINTDGEFESGYEKYWKQKYDFMFEGNFDDGNGGWGTFDIALYQRILDTATNKWAWVNLGKGALSGAGTDNIIELKVDRAKFNELTNAGTDPKPFVSTFQTGMTFYYTVHDEATGKNTWETMSVLPNAAISASDAEGKANLVEITFPQ